MLTFPCLLAVTLSVVTAFPSGARDFSCPDLQPGHGKNNTNNGVYHLHVSDRGVRGGHTLEVRIEGIKPFKGFLIKAVREATDEYIGSFRRIANTDNRCRGSGLTHTDGRDLKMGKRLEWVGPTDVRRMVGVQFKASIVENIDDYYYATSDPIMLLPTTTPGPTTTTTTTSRPRPSVTNPPVRPVPQTRPDPRDPMLQMSADERRQVTQVAQISRATIRWAWQSFLRILFPNVNFGAS